MPKTAIRFRPGELRSPKLTVSDPTEDFKAPWHVFRLGRHVDLASRRVEADPFGVAVAAEPAFLYV